MGLISEVGVGGRSSQNLRVVASSRTIASRGAEKSRMVSIAIELHDIEAGGQESDREFARLALQGREK